MRNPGQNDDASGLVPVVISAAVPDPVDVPAALVRVGNLRGDEKLAVALVELAWNSDAATIVPVLSQLARIKDEGWRVRTLFSVIGGLREELRQALPDVAQDLVMATVDGLRRADPRAVALRKIRSDVPAPLLRRLLAAADALPDPLDRIRAIVNLDASPGDERMAGLLEAARNIADPDTQRAAWIALAPALSQPRLAEAFEAAAAIADADASTPAMIRISDRFDSEQARADAHVRVLARAESISRPQRKFDVLAALEGLPPDSKRRVDARLMEVALAFDDADVRCRALFAAGARTDDEVARTNALRAGIAAAELVPDPARRAELLAQLRPLVGWVHPAVRAEVRRAVERLPDGPIRGDLRNALSRFFVREPSPATEPPPAAAPSTARTGPSWDVFISYATPDLDAARSVAHEMKSRGLSVFLSGDTLDAAVGSTGWIRALDAAIEASHAMLVLVTPHALRSKWVPEEWAKFYRVIVDRQSGSLVSLLMNGPAIADLPLTLRAYQVLESSSGHLDPSLTSRLLDIVRR